MQRDLVNAGLSTQALIGLQHNFDVEILTKERPPTLCACVALGPILIMDCDLTGGYLHFVLVLYWVQFG